MTITKLSPIRPAEASFDVAASAGCSTVIMSTCGAEALAGVARTAGVTRPV